MIVLDTHAWLWWVSDPDALSPAARRAADEARKEGTLLLSSISAWEVALLVAKGRLELSMGVAEWIARSEAIPSLRFVPVDNAIALQSVHLPGVFHADPADRIIVATALRMGARLVTKDERLRQYRHVNTVW